MVEFDLVAALVGGFVGTVAMTAMMMASKKAGMSDMPPMPLVMGSMMTGDRKKAMAIGGMIHLIVMGTIVFGIAYGLLFDAFDNDAWWVGALIGAAHGVLVGAVFMPMMPFMHPRMSKEVVGSGARGGSETVVIDANGAVELAAPGFMGSGWGGMTPAGLVMGHVVYGFVLALLYNAIT
jgi:hypothetical protein